MNSIKGKTAIVTGASRGIGRAIAIKLAAMGCNVVVDYAGNENAANETVKLCEEAGASAIAVCADVSDEASVEELIAKTQESFGNVDILVNNAGITRDNLMLRMSVEDFDEVISKNLRGAFLMTKYVGKLMLKQRAGRIVNISSIVGVHGNAGQANYSASKAGIIGLTKTTALEYASRGITANAIAPGFIDTDMTKALPDKVREMMLSRIPVGKFGAVEDVANAVAFFASDEARYITGQILGVDGGMGA
ncbi:3-oxoacyl-[acyl-carrier-protein] reductase [Oribacterium sp. WCC10]|uniref:3-oxoacyl-[acyl-carrier-protein] reductase n=1 Tax=Oribacterium sp. WCC10 TaxID=1855343 RepID=UPI0008E88ACC|nr:3-oxoacyl-[acyl-carrier-protein] reductase [Oribacterium sp. WCC10]SFG81611.1 3-oxoacyl-[acyl-carrier-protein] reductase [Oribacterium sp. WCC10]